MRAQVQGTDAVFDSLDEDRNGRVSFLGASGVLWLHPLNPTCAEDVAEAARVLSGDMREGGRNAALTVAHTRASATSGSATASALLP
jgi:hypothetical protein